MKFLRPKLLLLTLCVSGGLSRLEAQVIYCNTISWQVYTVNVATCATNFVVTGVAVNDMAVGANGLFYGLLGQEIFATDPVTGNSTSVGFYPNIISPTLEYGINGQLYLIDIVTGGLFQVNPLTGTSQLVGNFPSGWSSVGDLVYLAGNYYGTFNTPSGPRLVNVNVTNPAASTLLGPLPAPNLVGGASVDDDNCPKLYWFNTLNVNAPSTLWEYDVNNQTWTQICPGLWLQVGGADTPNDYSFPLVCNTCTTNAGNVTAQNLTICGTANTATVPFTGGQTLDADDILRYIIFEDENDPEGSILLQSASPNIAFNPATMQTGQTYFLGTVAGNNLNGSVNLADPCLDFSGAFAEVVWRALPTASFSGVPQEVCGGSCQTVSVNFTGAPPFSLTYKLTAGAVEQTFTQNFSNNTGAFQVCPPAGFVGNVMVERLDLTDANCDCGP